MEARTRSGRLLGALAAGAVVSMAPVTSAAAADPLPEGQGVQFENADVQGQCRLNVTDQDPTSGEIVGTFGGGASPTSLFGYGRNTFTAVECWVFDDSSLTTNLEYHRAATQGPLLLQDREAVRLPFDTSYVVCGRAEVTQRNGDTTFTPFECSS